jgi:phosphomannomutase
MAEIRDVALEGKFPSTDNKGRVEQLSVLDDYIEKLLTFVDKELITKKKIVANPNFGAAGKVIERLAKKLNLEIVKLNFEENGNFPKGRPDPLILENRKEITEIVKKTGADFGVAWDADADRCFFFDETGKFVDASYEMALLAQTVLEKYPGGKVIHDPRSVRVTVELATEAGGVPLMEKAGRSFIKNRMRKEEAVFGGETSGHFFYKDYYYCDSGMVTFLLTLQKICESGKQLSEIINPMRQNYPVSGEINFRVANTKERLKNLEEKYPDGQLDRIDGITITFPEWRFNVRSSNTEPLLRLNIEAKTRELVAQKVEELTNLIEE